jgi:murein DD-endopeptidase MepM/ murein hydrolase activator NlpD
MYTVKKGENLWSIAQEYNLSVNLILATNNIANPELISIGQEMKIPSHKNAVAKTKIVNQAVIEKNNNVNNNISQPENAEPIVYTVKAGDNLWNISRKYGVSMEVIVSVNNLKEKDLLSLGQKLEIPAIGGGVSNSNQKQEPTIITYTVVKGDTLWSISQRFDVKMISIISVNNLKEISRLSIGQKLKLPITNMDIAKAEGYSQEAVAEEIIYYVKKGESLWSISRNYNVKLESIIAANSISDASKISAGQQLRIPNVPWARLSIANFIWPVRGRISSPYGVRVLNGRKEFHAGIDIGGPTGTNIVAAESGRVSYTGYMRGYGNVIILSHDRGYSTVYGHNLVNLVKKGQYVKRGSIIGKVGRTGNASGSHLHFEIRLSGKPVNPLPYLK